MYTYIYSSVIHDSQKIEATQMSIDEWMHKQNTMYMSTYPYIHTQWNIIQS